MSLRSQHRLRVRQVLAAASLCLGAMLPARAEQPYDGPRIKLHVVGGLAGVHQYTRHERRFWTEVLPAKTAGRVTAEITPFDQAGVRGGEVLRLMQVGAVPYATALLGVSASTDPGFAADLAGLSPDIRTMRQIAAALRPGMAQALRERYGVELLAVYAYPAQMVHCASPFKGLGDLRNRRIRTSTPSQSDFVEALGATAVRTGFAEIPGHVRSRNVDCVITGAMSANTIGLHRMMSHVLSMPLSWGMSIFGSNAEAWRSLPPELRKLLTEELATLEDEIWAEAELETAEGISCNTGGSGCSSGERGHMVEVKPSTDDLMQRHKAFANIVVPRWLARCGPPCTPIWKGTIEPMLHADEKRR